MENKKQSSIEWLVRKLSTELIGEIPLHRWDEIREAVQQAKAMHKKEIEDAFGIGAHYKSTSLIGYHSMADEYYNETFGGQDERDRSIPQ